MCVCNHDVCVYNHLIIYCVCVFVGVGGWVGVGVII